ncbi:MAG: MBL fold metallo-hydrolase [Treponema sp.]|jgi:L-ascorbate metabolism protein UlaG (beta-lactamase superfamily)|nr:MBL fold metallo-hydrolase [Treponema sp.]
MNGERWYKKGRALLSEIEGAGPEQGAAYIWFMGQHGFAVKLNGLLILIDTILNDLKDREGKSIRLYPPPFAPEELYGVDYYLCTHDHADHLNLETILPLARVNPHACFIVPKPFRGKLTKAGIGESRVLGAQEGGVLSLGKNADSGAAVCLYPLAASHPDYSADENGDYVSLGYILKGGGISVYHAGDTWAAPRLVETLKGMAPIDIAMLPINGTDWDRTSRGIIGNMNILDAVKLSCVLNVDLTIPSHYDMMPNNSENPANFADCMYRLCPGRKFHIFSLGERFIYRK